MFRSQDIRVVLQSRQRSVRDSELDIMMRSQQFVGQNSPNSEILFKKAFLFVYSLFQSEDIRDSMSL